MNAKQLDANIMKAFLAYDNKENTQATFLCETALKLCFKHGYSRGIGACYSLRAKLSSRKYLWSEAIEEAKTALEYFQQAGDLLNAAHQMYLIASYYADTEQNDKAIELLMQTLGEFQFLRDSIGEAETRSFIAIILLQQAEYEKARENLQKAFALKMKAENIDDAASDLINIAAIYIFKHENEVAVQYLRQAIELKERYKRELALAGSNTGIVVYKYNGYTRLPLSNDKTIADAYLNLGIALGSAGKEAEAVDALDTALKMKQEVGDNYGEAIALNQLSVLALESKKYTKAEWYLLQALPLFQALHHKQSESTVCYNLSIVYLHTKRLKEARSMLVKAEELLRGINYPYGKALIFEQRGAIALHEKKFEKSERMLQKGLSLSQRIEAAEVEVRLWIQMGELYEKRSDDSAAVNAYHQALRIAEKQSLQPKKAETLRMLSIVHKKQGDLARALEYFEQFHEINNQLVQAQAARHLNTVQLLHQIEIHQKNEEIARIRIEQLQIALDEKQHELTVFGAKLIEKAEFIKNLEQGLENLLKTVKDEEGYAQTYQLLKLLRLASNLEIDWDNFHRQFMKVHQDFVRGLAMRFPDLTQTDLKLCCLIKLQLNTKEAARLLQISERGVETHRYRLRKKFGLSPTIDFGSFLAAM